MIDALLLSGLATVAPGVTASDLLGLVDIGPAVLSADREFVAFETRHADLERNAIVIDWKIIDLKNPSRPVDGGDGGEPIVERFHGQITGFTLPQRPQWSPDSRWIAYRAQHGGRIQIWRSDREGTRREQITRQDADVESFCWSHDGARVIYATSSGRAEFDRQLGEEGDRGYLYDERFSPYHSRTPLFDPGTSKAEAYFVRELTTEVERPATAEEVRQLAAVRDSSHDDPHGLLKDTRIDTTLGVNSPLTVTECAAQECRGYFKGAWATEQGRSVHFLRWANGRNYGSLVLYRWQVGRRTVSEVLKTNDLIEDCSLLRGQILCGQESATRPRRLMTIDLDTGKQDIVFDPNPTFANHEFGEVGPLTWQDQSGTEGFGHVVKPIGHISGNRYPLIIVQYRSRGFLRGGIGDEYPIHVFSANGFAVLSFHRPDDWELQPTVRSYEDLEAKNHIGLRERRRILSVLLAGIDYLDGLGLIDSSRVGLSGFSDGGETVGFALASQSHRFAAAAASWITHSPTGWYVYGPKFQRVLTDHGLGFPRGPTAERWQQLSLALNAKRVTTPLLIQVSDQELLPEAETVAALEAYGKPVELYVFPNEYHVKLQPRHRLAIYRRSLQWFQFWLQGIEVRDPLDGNQYARWHALRALSHGSGGAQPHLGSEGGQ